MSISGGIIRGKAVAGFNPTMQTFNGSTGYYSKSHTLASASGIMAIGQFQIDSFSGGGIQDILNVTGGSGSAVIARAISSDFSTADYQGKLVLQSQTSTPTNLCRVISTNQVIDGQLHTFFYSYNATTGAVTFYIDSADADDTENAQRVLTTGTLASGSGAIYVGANAAANYVDGSAGFIGVHQAHLTNPLDFITSNGIPIEQDFSDWSSTGFGSQPLLYHPDGKMENNYGSAGPLTKNGTITTAAATTAFMGIKNGIVGPVARAVVRPQEQASGFDAYLESLSPVVWYPFNDDSFATTIIDHGSASADLTSQNSTAASAGTPMRTTRSKSLAMPACTATNWSSQAAHYTNAGTTIAALQSGITAFTVAFSVRMAANSVNDDVYLFRLGTNGTTQDAPGFRCMMLNPSTTGSLGVQEKHTTGFNYPTSTSTGLDDGDVHFVVVRFGPAAYNLRLDGTEEVTAAWNKTTETTAAPFNLGGVSAVTVDPAPAWQSDCFAFWPSYLTDTQVATLSTKYLAEIA